MMNRFNRVAVAAAALALVAGPASASITYNLANVTLQGGGQMTGFFTLSDDLTALLNLDINVPTGTVSGFTFAPFHYTSPPDVLSYQGPLNAYVQADFPSVAGATEEMRLYFTQITTSGATILTGGFSYDHSQAAGTRQVTGGTVVAAAAAAAVPEPASLTILGMGLMGLGFAGRRRLKAAALRS